ncbi:MAG TPA: NifU family protein [Candidatus Babeliales bacterium]|nr:NifU family protein [Candidatus Babeliales bacterium]
MSMDFGNQEVIEKIQAILDIIRPAIMTDGGDIEFVQFQDGIVSIRLTGACVGCPAAMYTFKLGVQDTLMSQVPEIKQVVQVEA